MEGKPELAELFVPGEDLVYYENLDDLVGKADYFLHHEAERREIAENGFARVQKYHTYPIRLTQMLEIAFTKQTAP